MNNKYLGVLAVIFLCINNICFAQEISINDIISKIKSIDSVYYESTETPAFGTLSGWDSLAHGKTWFKTGYLRKEIYYSANDRKLVKVFTPEDAYIYNSVSDKTEKWDPIPNILNLLSDFQLNALEKGVSCKILGTDRINNEPVTVIEYVQDFDRAGAQWPNDMTMENIKVKSWISNEKGVPLKQEIQWQKIQWPTHKWQDHTYTQIIEYKNYNFEAIPDEVFAVLK